ncbi:MAG: hypothetical protein ACOY4O_03050 [Pseudomonadota bacterium]
MPDVHAIDEFAVFESATPSIVRSIKQRDLLNTWLRLYARAQQTPQIADYHPERMSDELLELALFAVDHAVSPPRLIFERESMRMAAALGHASNGRVLDDYLGPQMAAIVMPVYYECISRALPVYTIFAFEDVHGRKVDYERLLLPFADGQHVDHIIASHKNISEDGNFEINNLMRVESLPAPQLLAVIDRDLVLRLPGRGSAQDISFD